MESNFSLTTACYYVPLALRLGICACLLWPLLAARLLRRGETSAAPLAAIAVPLAITVGLVWHGLSTTARGLMIAGTARPAAVGAALAEAMWCLPVGVFFGIVVAVAVAIRRHRPMLDRMTAAMFAVLFVNIAGALLMARSLNHDSPVMDARIVASILVAGMIGSALVVLTAVAWTFLCGSGRVISRRIPHGVTMALALLLVVEGAGFLAMQQYREQAMSGRRAVRE